VIVRLVPLLSGLLFGAGLHLGGMTDPVRVRAFLDPFGAWDPTLAFVMAGAVAVMSIAWLVQRRSPRPWLAERYFLPSKAELDGRLIGGAALFGVGWGLAGLCPGPGFTALAIAPLPALMFVVAMLAGMALTRVSPGA
jgi:uncharacterized membrane protein YedE/YeeE